MKKICTKCGKEKEEEDFYIRTSRGRMSACKKCHLELVKRYSNTEVGREASKRAHDNYYETEKGKASRKRRLDRYRKTEKGRAGNLLWAKKYIQSKKGKLAKQKASKKYGATEYGYSLKLYLKAKRRAVEKLAFPKWANLESIELVYKKAHLLGLEVDHVVPLQSELVCGLHTWDNLQLLGREENIKKGNRVWPDMPGEEDVNNNTRL
jgi:hypothetical protein